MTLDYLRKLARDIRPETYLGRRCEPLGFVISNNDYSDQYPAHVPYQWRAICVFPDGSTVETVFKTAAEARAWALSQTKYIPSLRDIAGDNREWSAE